METCKRGGHTVWDCKYHIVWIPKYRYDVLGGEVGQRCRELIRETARAHEMVIHAGSVNRDHIHLLISIPPNLGPIPTKERKVPQDLTSFRRYRHARF